MKFSEKYSVVRTAEDDWYDTYLPADTNLFVDPFLIWDEKSGFWAGAHTDLIEFFDMVFDLIRKSGGDKNSIYWKQASSLLIFPEPPEFCLGVAEGNPLGSGSSLGLQKEMLDGISTAVNLGMYNIAHMEAISLFQGGMGIDRIGDCVCNILKSYFIKYTEQICERHNIPTEPTRVRNAAWSVEYCKWQERLHQLPTNTITYNRKGKEYEKKIATLLTPERFLRVIPVAESDGFWTWSWSTMGKELRGDFNFHLARHVQRPAKARMARQNPEAVVLYLSHLEEQDHKPYPIGDDPKLLVNWYNDGKQFVPDGEDIFIPASRNEFGNFVLEIVSSYQHGIEHGNALELLWHNGIPRAERAAQALFQSVAIHYCKANNIDLSGESNAGRGPVDFKFSAGWKARALVEMKLVRNSKFWNGILAQQPEYQIAEEVEVGYFVAIAFTDNEFTDEVKKKIEKAAKISSEAHGVEITGILIDARQKKSASKLKNEELSTKLHSDKSEPPKDSTPPTGSNS